MRLVQFWTEPPHEPWSGGFRSPVGSPRLSGRPQRAWTTPTILGLTQHSSASNAYSPGRRQTAPTLSGVLATQDSRGFFVLASPSVEVTPPPIPQRAMDFAEGIRLQK